jgi:hypothetical protein
VRKPLININVNIPERCAIALERIAAAFERAVPPIPEAHLGFKKRGVDSIVSYGDNRKSWQRENYGEAVRARGLSPEQEAQEIERLMHLDNAEEEESLPPELL